MELPVNAKVGIIMFVFALFALVVIHYADRADADRQLTFDEDCAKAGFAAAQCDLLARLRRK